MLLQWMQSCGSVVEYDLTHGRRNADLICVEALLVDVKDVDVAVLVNKRPT